MLQFVLSQDCDKQSKLEFLCNHANAFVLYVLEDAEYIIEVSLPDVLQENRDNILQYYGQNRENRYGYPYNYNSDSIKEWTRSQYTKVYKVEGKFFKLVDKTRILEKCLIGDILLMSWLEQRMEKNYRIYFRLNAKK